MPLILGQLRSDSIIDLENIRFFGCRNRAPTSKGSRFRACPGATERNLQGLNSTRSGPGVCGAHREPETGGEQ